MAQPKIHILGISGTFMAGIARLAQALGYRVTGSDLHCYPPMSTQLSAMGIEVFSDYDPIHLPKEPYTVLVGNVVTRGNPSFEYVLNRGIPYQSGPAWLFDNLLKERWVLAVAGTHGKTTTSSMLAWILSEAGMDPGFLIGGMPGNFEHSANLGAAPFFVIEADEYDTALFDKRSKFLHYRPRTLVYTGLEFDHIDIFKNIEAIQGQVHQLFRSMPSEAAIILPTNTKSLEAVVAQGCWTPRIYFGEAGEWTLKAESTDFSQFAIYHHDVYQGSLSWQLVGKHNANNALAALIAARHAGISPAHAIQALSRFLLPKRRLEVKAKEQQAIWIDDFAHHPTAIAVTLEALKSQNPENHLIAILAFDSHTMRSGYHKTDLLQALEKADQIIFYVNQPLHWDIQALQSSFLGKCMLAKSLSELKLAIENLKKTDKMNTIVAMSNKEALVDKLL